MIRKRIAVVVFIGLPLLLVPLMANAAGGGTLYNISWVFDDEGILTISGEGAMHDFTVGVDADSRAWRNLYTRVKKVVIEDGITSIGDRAFRIFKNMTSISIPDSVVRIGDEAFLGCEKLESIMIPANVSSIGSGVFSLCTGLTNIDIPENVSSISNNAFSGCTGLTSMNIPNHVTNIGNYAFGGCRNLADISFPENLTSIGIGAFQNCESLKMINVPESVTSIGESAFADCTELTEFIIPPAVSSIENSLFSGCSNLTGITIPTGVTSIGKSAFSACSSLKSVQIPESVNSIGERAFSECTGLMSFTLPSLVEGSIGDYTFFKCTDLKSITIPEGITSIGGDAFRACSSLKSITIPNGVTSIGAAAFESCTNLADISIPDSVTSIGSSAFEDCRNLTEIVIPDGVKNIWSYTFYNCNNLASVTIPDSIISIGSYAFFACNSLTEITVPEAVTHIGSSAFYSCNGVKSIIIPDNLTDIVDDLGVTAFNGYSGNICCSVGSAAAYALSKVKRSFRPKGEKYNLQYLYTEDEITGVEISNADKDIATCVIPDFVTSIRERAFYGCSHLKEIMIPEGVTTIGKSAFWGCNALMSVEIPENINTIEYGTFYSCQSLTSITIPEKVTSIGGSAFEWCRGMKSITIPKGVISIGDRAFKSSGIEEIAFMNQDYNQDIFMGDELFMFMDPPTVFCYMYTSTDSWASSQYVVIYLDDTDMDSIRKIQLPTNFSMAVGEVIPLRYTFFPDDLSSVTWTSSDPSIATVENGIVHALESGDVVITAKVGSVSAEVAIRIYTPATSIYLSESELWLVAKDSVQISIKGYSPDNADAIIAWCSSDTSLATVDETGYVMTIKPGDVTIMASSVQGVEASCLLHLCYPVTSIIVDQPVITIHEGESLQLKATAVTRDGFYENKLLTFTSDNDDIVLVDTDRTGMIIGKEAGSAKVVVSSGNDQRAEIEVKVIPFTHKAILPDALVIIEEEAFSNSVFEKVSISNQCTMIGARAFAGSADLMAVHIPESVTSIDETAFDGCTQVVIYCKSGSAAETFAISNNLPYVNE